MAKTAERKLEIAQRIHDIVTAEYELPPGALIFDALTFTLATGDPEFLDSAVETIEGIRAIKRELPGVLTSLGVSNVLVRPQAGRARRAQLGDAASLRRRRARHGDRQPQGDHAVRASSTRSSASCATISSSTGAPDALQRVIEHLGSAEGPSRPRPTRRTTMPTQPIEVRIHHAILRRRKDGIEAKIDEALLRARPVDVLNNVLLPAMKEVGDKFGSGELILPFVLQSAEVMKKAVAHLEQFLERKEGVSKGKIVLATVFGDVHDIGKNLVNTILTNNGYTVYDLGKQVPMNVILEKAIEVERRRDRSFGAARVDLEADADVRQGTGRARPRRFRS